MADLQPHPRPSAPEVLFNVVRGGLIGLAELIPGVSGGTIALVTGVYERALDAGNHLISAVKALVMGPDRRASARHHLARVEWWLVVPMLVGMAVMVLSLAGTMERFVTQTPTLSRGLFLGMVAASVAVPLLMIDRRGYRRQRSWAYVLVFAGTAAVAAFLTSAGGGRVIEDPQPWLVFGAAAVAICALALPGVSGSFFLLVIGLYAPTLAAVDQRDLGYVAIFGLGALTGLVLFIRILHWLLAHHHTGMMFAMSGLLLGSLRALWPWQDRSGNALGPDGDVTLVAALAIAGALIVVALVVLDRVLTARAAIADGEQSLPEE